MLCRHDNKARQNDDWASTVQGNITAIIIKINLKPHRTLSKCQVKHQKKSRRVLAATARYVHSHLLLSKRARNSKVPHHSKEHTRSKAGFPLLHRCTKTSSTSPGNNKNFPKVVVYHWDVTFCLRLGTS